jgi:large subunit ribosomal protein L4
MELEVLNTGGQKTGKKVALTKTVFGVDPNDHAIYLDVKQYLANQRQGTHKTLERSEVSGSTKKLKKQKGTGGARAGSIKNIQFVGGPRAFGPRPRNYDFKLNKKVKQLARRSALSYKAKESQITVLEDFNFENPKTKQYIELLKSLELTGKKTLLVLPTTNTNVVLSSRNLKNAKVTTANGLSTYDVLNASHVIFSESGLKGIENLLSN